ncbi:MAG TPA: cytochrome c [Gemmatimonadaceae bacterium]|nr:cytochrome c [Gemmatimonadaceae bacterium]
MPRDAAAARDEERAGPGRVHSDAPESPQQVEADVERLHRAILREPRDPEEGREPAPWWVWTAMILVTFWGGWYLGRFGGTFDARAHTALRGRDVVAGSAAAGRISSATADPIQAGQRIFAARCQTCHQPDGMGVPGTFPPLRGSEWVNGPAERMIRIILNGLHGPVTVAGKTYNGVMPAWRDQLSDAEIAAVATYVRQWKPNSAPPVTPQTVVALRAATANRDGKPWTAEELQAVGPASTVPAPRGGAARAHAGGAR